MTAENGRTLVTKKVICGYLQISERTFDQLADPNLPADERLPVYSFTEGGTWRMDISDYDRWKERRKETA